MGLPYFYMGEKPILFNYTDKCEKMGAVGFQDSHHEANETIADKLFSDKLNEVSKEQRDFVESYLGVNSNLSPSQIRWIIWKQFFLNIDKVFTLLWSILKNKIQARIKP
jgi:hypothetical protein